MCGEFRSEMGGTINVNKNHSFVVEDTIFLSEYGKISGSGQLQLTLGRGVSEVSLPVEEAKTVLDLKVRRNWKGEIILWHWIDDPDTGLRETFVQMSSC